MKHFLQKDRYRNSIIITIFILLLALIIVGKKFVENLNEFSFDSAAFSIAISTVETMGIIISLLIAIKQLVDSKEIARATFISDLNKSFVENEDYIDLYNKLQCCLERSCTQRCGDPYDFQRKCNLNVTKGQISNYLTFFETVYILRKNGVITFEVLDDLFAYRFFLVVHSKIVQQEKIKHQPYNFKNIFCLEYEWLNWRKEHRKTEISVYNRLLLKDLIGEDEYIKITEECRK